MCNLGNAEISVLPSYEIAPESRKKTFLLTFKYVFELESVKRSFECNSILSSKYHHNYFQGWPLCSLHEFFMVEFRVVCNFLEQFSHESYHKITTRLRDCGLWFSGYLPSKTQQSYHNQQNCLAFHLKFGVFRSSFVDLIFWQITACFSAKPLTPATLGKRPK